MNYKNTSSLFAGQSSKTWETDLLTIDNNGLESIDADVFDIGPEGVQAK